MTGAKPIWLVVALAAPIALAAPPASQPARDETMDWLLSRAATSPTTEPAGEPTSKPSVPFADTKDDRGARRAVLMTSDGEKIRGRFCTTRDKPLRVWDEKDKEYRDIPFALVKSLEAEVLWERDQPDWAFKESGSDIKVFTGKSYPARELIYKLTLVNGQSVSGGIVAPLYLLVPDGDKTFVLNKRQKGPVGQALKDLIYVKSVAFE